ncbi:MAG: glutathionylspermidine synthase family protein [Alphaproteobacteria bacterium]|nr:glutathionylspermidine synthase family protein [Alphaproteobacteria bacterium]
MSDRFALADALLRTGLVNDPWIDGEDRFEAVPIVLSPERLRGLHAAAEAVFRLHQEAVELFDARPELLDFLGLTPVQALIWKAAAPHWHGYARADVFELEDGGIAVCELNCDTPTGHPEALALNQVVAPAHPGLSDPNTSLSPAMQALFARAARDLAPGLPRRAGLVYPTEMSEDLGAVLLFQRWAEAIGFEVVLGSPFNLDVDATGQPTLCGAPISLLLRHYKTDWWTERLPVWEDAEPFEDSAPLARELHLLLRAEAEGRLVSMNPFGAVVPQNKRVLAFLWERIDLFSPASRADIQRYVPESVRMEAMHPEQLLAERELWVLKSDYGCEGDEVVIGIHCTPEEWALALKLAVPGRWIAQRRFAPRIERDGRDVNWGVFGVAGVAHGAYARLQHGHTDYSALSVPALVDDGAVE